MGQHRSHQHPASLVLLFFLVVSVRGVYNTFACAFSDVRIIAFVEVGLWD
jgi:hypothetical protein